MVQAGQGQFDQQIREAAAQAQLGEYRGGYESSSPTFDRRLRIGWVLWAVFVTAAVVGLASGQVALVILGGLPGVVIGIRLVIAQAASKHYAGAQLDVYERGVVVVDKGVVRVVRYADSMVLDNTKRNTQYGSTLSIDHSFGLTDTQGKNLVIGSRFEGTTEWGPWVQQDSANAQLPGALERLRAGEKLDFGILWVTSQEIGSGGKGTPWNQVERVDIKDGSIAVHVAGRRSAEFNSFVRLTPNVSLFQALTRQLHQRTAG